MADTFQKRSSKVFPIAQMRSSKVFPMVQIKATICPFYKNITSDFWKKFMFYFKHLCY